MTVTTEPDVQSVILQYRDRAWPTAIGAGLVIGVAGSTLPGLGMALAVIAVQLGLAGVVRGHTVLLRLVLLSAALTPLLVLRDNRWLMLCVLFSAAVVFGFVAVAAGTRQSAFDFAVGAPLRLVSFERRASAESTVRQVSPYASGAMLAAPVVIVFWLLLSDADQVFAAIVGPEAVPAGRVLLAVFSVLGAGFWYRYAESDCPRDSASGRQPLGMIETTIVLGAVNVLFVSFVLIRLLDVPEELTDAEWRSEVRSGFFQLLWVAGLTVVLLVVLRLVTDLAEPANSVRFRRLARSTVVLAAMIDVIALLRIAEYVDRSFLSPLRFWSFGFGCWLLVVLALGFVRVGPWWSDRQWFTGALVGVWLLFVLAMGLANPDRQIAEHNFANPPDEGVISVLPLMWLSEDATPTIVANIEALRPLSNRRYERMIEHLCELDSETSWRDVHPSRSDARTSIDGLCASSR